MIQIDASPHAGQRKVHTSPARFKILAAGRRWGKTRLGVNECLDTASQGGRAWWVSPSYKTSEVGWRPLRRIARKTGAEIRKVERQVTLPGGGTVTVRSADNPDSLRGEGLDFVVLDECAFMKQEAWLEALRPALSDKMGKALFISTPKGRNWFWQLWRRGNQNEPDYESWQFPTSDNPYIVESEIAAAQRNLPERIFRQEYLADFIEDAGAVFRRVMDCAIAKEHKEPVEDHEYLFGVDWGKSNDFTVIIVLDIVNSAIAYMDRFNQIDYAIQTQRLQVLAERFKPTAIIAEQNSMGEPLIEQLQRSGLPVQPFMTTSATKTVAIESLVLAFERQEIAIIPDQVLIGELQAYTMDRLPSGRLRYAAPAGMHDDTVMALALAWHGVGNSQWLIS